MANLPGEDLVELVIKRYPGGRFSGLLGREIGVGSTLQLTGPYGALRVHDSEQPILMIAGGSGMAPVLSLLRELSRRGCERPVRFFYGARTEQDLFWVQEIERLGERLPDFRFTPVVGGFVHEAVDDELEQPDVYMCGPPPMVEAAQAMLDRRGVDEQRIFVDKFTTSAAAAAPAPAVGVSEREFAWFAPAGRRATLYEDVTIDTQPSVHRHLTRGWPVSFEDGRGTWDERSTALRSGDWFAFRDPGEQWERPFYQGGSAAEQQIEGAVGAAARDELFADFDPRWVEFLREVLQVPAFVEHGLWFALATIARDCLSDSVATAVCLEAAMKQRSAQAIVLYAMELERHHGPFPIERAREQFLRRETWQPLRRLLERLAATRDWGEVVLATNLCFEPIVGTLLRREVGIRAAVASGDSVTPTLARVAGQEWDWARSWTVSLVRMLVGDAEFGSANRAVIEGWVGDWLPLARSAAEALMPVFGGVLDSEGALARVRSDAEALLADCGLGAAQGIASGARTAHAASKRRRVRAPRPAARLAASETPSPSGGYDFVGIVMAKSAEGDAVAEILGRREGIEVIEQPAFWDIRARDRLTIPFSEVSEQLGYEIDAYSIQHEMSTHYGRMVSSDDALMLFSDPTEAMAHLMS
jgi:ferredoxin-NADP reductase